MSQDQWIILLLKIVLLADVASIAAFVAIYWRLAPWYRNPIGRTIVIKDILLILVLIPSILSLFLQFNRLTSHVAAWLDIGLFALMGVTMAWRSAVWLKIYRQKQATLDRDTEEASR